MNFSPTFFFTKQSGTTSSTNVGRELTTAHGRGCHDLLNRNSSFFTLQTKEGMRELLDIFVLPFFTCPFFIFKSKRLGRSLGLLNFKNCNRCMSALVRVDA